MKAVWLDLASRRIAEGDVTEPVLESGHQVLIRVAEVGVCGTDRELATFAFGEAPAGETTLIPGHEALGQVVAVGAAVTNLKSGDWVVPTVRRACVPPCRACARNRRDLCVSGGYAERGIFRLHGYMSERAVDFAEDLMPVPEAIVDFAVLAEPLSVVEKAIEKAVQLHEEGIGRALVLGAGPIGFLAALALQVRGIEVAIHSAEPPAHPKIAKIASAGIRYCAGLNYAAPFDLVVEATGSPQAAFAGFRCLGPSGVYAVLGGGAGDGHLSFLDLVRKNQIVFGSVNASPDSMALAVADLGRLDRRVLEGFIRRVPLADFGRTILDPPRDTFKLVHVMTE
ncbi:MAG: glucose dehydrogenase [Bryobacterales bacterium]|nr:glucose dehydrogenase [Bryobacterales bacterium]